jgi:hypothetical protein
MRLVIVIAACLSGCLGDNCKPIPACTDLGWDGTAPLPCHFGSPRTCTIDGQTCAPVPDQVKGMCDGN